MSLNFCLYFIAVKTVFIAGHSEPRHKYFTSHPMLPMLQMLNLYTTTVINSLFAEQLFKLLFVMFAFVCEKMTNSP